MSSAERAVSVLISEAAGGARGAAAGAALTAMAQLLANATIHHTRPPVCRTP
jgi:hypothetical protein